MIKLARFIYLGVILMLLMVMFSACSTETQQNNTDNDTNKKSKVRMIKHFNGETAIPTNPKKIAVLSYGFEDQLLSLGIKPVAAVSYTGKEFPPYLAEQMEGVTSLGFGYEVNLEALLQAEPDLIIGVEGWSDKTYDQLSKIAPTVVLDWKETASNWKKSLIAFGEILGKEQEAEQLLKAYDDKLAATKEKLQDTAEGKTVAMMLVMPKEYRIYGGDSDHGIYLYEELGLTPANGVPMDGDLEAVSLEILPEMNPDYLFIMDDTEGQVDKIKELEESPIYKDLRAVKNGNVFPAEVRLWHMGRGPIGYNAKLDEVLHVFEQE